MTHYVNQITVTGEPIHIADFFEYLKTGYRNIPFERIEENKIGIEWLKSMPNEEVYIPLSACFPDIEFTVEYVAERRGIVDEYGIIVFKDGKSYVLEVKEDAEKFFKRIKWWEREDYKYKLTREYPIPPGCEDDWWQYDM